MTEGAMTLSNPPQRIALLTDFGVGPYVGQMLLLLNAMAPNVSIVSMLSDLPAFRPDLAAYLLPGLTVNMPSRTVYVCVVDPGVGTERAVLIAQCGEDWWLAPDNGCLVPLLRRQPEAIVYRLQWRPEGLSASFHGRDLFAPIAAALVAGTLPASERIEAQDLLHADWPLDAWRICYIDAFGNLLSGLRAGQVADDACVEINGQRLHRARTFGEVAVGEAFWYENAFGLVEVAINQGRADVALGGELGTSVGMSE
jgi:S-adenosylmethionine hydrolase